jgi:hypothetical protein
MCRTPPPPPTERGAPPRRTAPPGPAAATSPSGGRSPSDTALTAWRAAGADPTCAPRQLMPPRYRRRPPVVTDSRLPTTVGCPHGDRAGTPARTRYRPVELPSQTGQDPLPSLVPVRRRAARSRSILDVVAAHVRGHDDKETVRSSRVPRPRRPRGTPRTPRPDALAGHLGGTPGGTPRRDTPQDAPAVVLCVGQLDSVLGHLSPPRGWASSRTADRLSRIAALAGRRCLTAA